MWNLLDCLLEQILLKLNLIGPLFFSHTEGSLGINSISSSSSLFGRNSISSHPYDFGYLKSRQCIRSHVFNTSLFYK